MPSVDLQHPLSVPAVPARAAASSIIHEIAEQRGEWAEFALYLNLGAIGLPDVGYIAVPVRVEDVREEIEPRHEIHFTLKARRSPEAFPVFRGGIGIDATGPSNSVMWLAGSYDLPLGGIGSVVNETLAHGTAGKTLENMLAELGGAVVARVEKREFASARYRLIFRTGD